MVRAEPRLRRDRWPRVGGFRHLVRDDRWEWSDEVAHMHGYVYGTVDIGNLRFFHMKDSFVLPYTQK